MPGRTRGQSRVLREEMVLQPGESEQALSHYLGSLSMMGRTAFVSMMAEHEDTESGTTQRSASPRPSKTVRLPSE